MEQVSVRRPDVAAELLSIFELPAIVAAMATREAVIGQRRLPAPPRVPTCTELHEMGVVDMGVECASVAVGATVAPRQRAR